MFRPGKLWWIAYYVQGIECRESSGSEDKREAQELLKRRVDEKAAQRLGLLRLHTGHRLTIKDLLDALLADYRIRGRKSIRETRYRVNTILRDLGDERASSVTAQTLRDYIDRRLQGGAARATVNRELAALQRAFNIAYAEGRVSTVPPFTKLTEANTRRGFFEQWEVDAVCQALPDYLQGLVRFAYLTGWRLGELSSLTWGDVDLVNRVIMLGTSKNGRGRVIPLRGELWEIIEGQRVNPAATVFHRDGFPVRDFRKAWASACDLVGLPGRHFHDLRRSGVRNLVRAGVDPRVAMEITGHKTRAVFDRYNITTVDDMRGAFERLDTYLGNVRDLGHVQPNVQPGARVSKGRGRRTGT